jgi:regulator of RNase E activity RraA
MKTPYTLAEIRKLVADNPNDPPYTALFYDPIDIALQKPDNESYDQRHEKIAAYLIEKGMRTARDLFLSADIKLLNSDRGILIDSAFTVQLGEMKDRSKTGQAQLNDIFDQFEAIKAAEGCMMVINNNAPRNSPSWFAAVWGGIMSNSTHQLGCSGVITNGFVRDQAQLDAMAGDFNYLVFGKGNCALDARGHIQIDYYQNAIQMPGLDFGFRRENLVPVNPGDLVVADRDGAIVIPKPIAREVLELSIERYKAEKYIVGGIRAQNRHQVIPFIKEHGIL